MSRDSVKTECIAAQQNVVPEKGVRYLLSDRCGNKQTWKSCLISFVLLFIFNGIAPLSMFIYLGSLFSWVLLSHSYCKSSLFWDLRSARLQTRFSLKFSLERVCF